jgi:hypothetical protein
MLLRCTGSILLLSSALIAAERGQDVYQSKILPVLEQYCYDCHSDGVKKGRFSMDEHADYAALLKDQKHWDHVRQMMVTQVMPPLDKEEPSQQQRDEIVQWIDGNVFYSDPARPDPGHVTLRRLNRTEYDNTIRDVFQLQDYRLSAEFPPDDTGYGFDNIASVLKLSPLLMEKYLRAARKVSERVMEIRYPERADLELGSNKFTDRKNQADFRDGAIWFTKPSSAVTYFKVPSDGIYSFTAHAAQAPAGDEPAKLRVKLDDKVLGEFEVEKEWRKGGGYQHVHFSGKLSRGNHKLSIGFENDFYDEKAPAGRQDRNLSVDKVDVSGPSGTVRPEDSAFLRWLDPTLNAALPSLNLSGEDLLPGEGPSTHDVGAMILASNGYVRYPLEIHEAGRYRFKLKLGSMQAGKDAAHWELRLGEKVLKAGEITAKNQAPQWFELETELPMGTHDMRVAFTNDYYDAATNQDRNLWVHEVNIVGPLNATQQSSALPLPQLVQRMGERIFRRPLGAEENEKWNSFATACTKAGEGTRGTVGLLIEGMLSSPAFLFRPAPQPAGERIGNSELIDESSLASRLSYFLWAAPPDEELQRLAREGKLRANLDQTVRRMLQDWRAYSLQDDFAGQWLQLRDTDMVNPSKRYAPDWDGSNAYYMRVETQKFFEHILKENRSVIEFLNGDYTFLNKRLAKWYELEAPELKGMSDSKTFTKVSLKGTQRAGLLTQGSILAITSNPTRTNIVRRGKFLLENILGTPPPPVPGDVPPLNEEKLRRSKLTLRQEFEAHREAVNCAGCHAFLDPMGFALEQYDALGRFRTKDHGQPVDSAGQLVRGQKFADFAQLRDILVRDQADDFLRSLTENLLTYALGRGLEYYDRAAVTEIMAKTKQREWKFQELILHVCQSVPFQRMRI